MKLKKNSQGQSLVEVLIAIAIVTVVLITLVAAVVIALAGARFAKEKVKSNFLVQEGLEWVRSQRSALGWEDFLTRASPTGARYCLASLNFDWIGSCPESQIIDTLYTRELVLTVVSSTQVKIDVAVSWKAGGKDFLSTTATTLAEWSDE